MTRKCSILLENVDCSRACAACVDEWAERAALIQYLPRVPLTRPAAEALAREQLRSRIAKDRRGQMYLAI